MLCKTQLILFVLLCLLLGLPAAASAETVQFDFVTDRDFPADAERKREFAAEYNFSKNGITVAVTGTNQNGNAAEVSRRGPGGLGVKGNGDRDRADGGTTSGNRVNSGEALLFSFSDDSGNPLPVEIVEIVFSRIVRDLENFPEAPATGFELRADDQIVASGELSTDAGNIAIAPQVTNVYATFSLSNLTPFHAIANRFRLESLSVKSTSTQ